MVSDTFSGEYLRVARLADPELVEQMEWQKTEGAVLERAVAEAKELVSELGAMQFIEKEAEGRDRRLDLSSIGMRQTQVASFYFRAAGGEVRIWAQPFEEGPFTVMAGGKPMAADFYAATKQWVEASIGLLFSTLNRL